MNWKFLADKNQSGVGLIEVLVAVVLISIGFLAAAQMQVRSMRYSQEAYFLTQANFMLRDISDRMRANRDGVASGFYNGYSTNSAVSLPSCINAETQCSAAQIAAADQHAWRNYLHAPSGAIDFKPLLPSSPSIQAAGTINFDAISNIYNITVQWSELIDNEQAQRELSIQLIP